MWELIRGNIRKSWILFISMGFCLIGLGYLIGMVWLGPDAGIYGVLIACGVWFILSLLSYFQGDSILLLSSRAKEVTYDVHPQLFNVVEEMKIAASFPAMPKIYIIDSPALNAFATGKSVEKSSIAITAGLLSRLNRDELQGVIAHEMSHIMNRDVLYMTIAGIMLGSIVMLSQIFLRSMWFSGGSGRRYRASSSKGGGGQAQLILLIVGIVFAILAPIIARIFYFSLSRKREYLADASAVRLTRYPFGLASALTKISASAVPLASANKVTAPMYIANPLKKQRNAVGLFSTHPPIDKRIGILKSMAQGVNYTNYQRAFSQITGVKAGLMPPSALRDIETIAMRESSVKEVKPQKAKEEARDLGDLMRALNRYVFIACVCGLKIKIPPNFKKPEMSCPRCGRQHTVPLTDLKTVTSVLGATMAVGLKDKAKPAVDKSTPQVYARKGKGWESLNCHCGTMLQVSPLFAGSHLTCHNCKNKINIKG